VPTVYPILASIPSPSDNAISIGGLELRAYGLAIALGVIAAVWIARRRWATRGGDPDDISRIALWAVLAGLIGARLYHVLTDLHRFEGRWHHAFAVWEGGLGIPGGLIAGVATGAYIAHRRGLPVAQLLDVVAPAVPVAQAIGRLGNWFNQELFGRPTDLPWGLEIDPEHRPAGYLDVATFHPTFLYEALWNLALAGGLVLWERHHPGSRPGRLFALYVAGYAIGRAWVEALRIDPATRLFGVRWNIWMSALTFFAAVAWLVFDSWRARRKAESEPTVADTADDTAAAGTTTDDTAPADTTADDTTDDDTTDDTAPADTTAGDTTDDDTTDDDDTAATTTDDDTTDDTAAADATAADETTVDHIAADTAEVDQPTAVETVEGAGQPDTGEPADQPDEAETTAQEPVASGPADMTADSADAAERPASPAGNDPAADDATGDEPVTAGSAADDATGDEPVTAGSAADDATGAEPVVAIPESDRAITADPETGERTDPAPVSGAGAETADEEAAT
jgi:prolipoprotein diacylglyceryl transferase